jgi:hypothetical protein
MKSQNVTLRLSTDTIRKIKVVAAERGSSISSLLTAKLEELVGEDAEYQAARRRALEWLAQGWHLGGPPPSPLRGFGEARS